MNEKLIELNKQIEDEDDATEEGAAKVFNLKLS
jgi:hypothetical protein